MQVLISPSILSADFGRINEEIAEIEPYSDMIHLDVMDGHFVPNITFGAPVLAKMKIAKPVEAHLMIENPEKYLKDFAYAITKAHGRRDDSYITVHQEVCPDLSGTIKKIKALGVRAGVSINPATPLSAIEPFLGEIDLALLMTVNPGFGGRKFIEDVVPKIIELRKKAPQLNIAVDGGINDKTAKIAVAAGANILVAGSYIFKEKDRAAVIKKLRE